MTKGVYPLFLKQKGGKIINISSIGGVMGHPLSGIFIQHPSLQLEGYSEALALEVHPFHIKSAVQPEILIPGLPTTGISLN